jgi:DNA-binding CsgD family transcriptional regulator
MNARIDLDLLEQIHDVTLGRVRWEEVLECVRAEFDAELCALRVYAGTPGETRGLSTAGHDGRPWHQYAAHFAAIDPFAAAMRSGRMPAGTMMQGDQLVPPHRFCSSEYYQDWFRPNGLRYVAGAYVHAPEGHYFQMGIPRSPDAGPFDAAEIARLQRYFNHIWRALRMQEERAARALEPDFDALARTFGLTGAEARLIHSLTETGSLKRSAQRIDRSYYTLRAQLRSVFTKTATRSQVELMRLIHQGWQDPERARTGSGWSPR